ncbi:MAG: DUF4185 domain-containing protein, partial [Micrococcales bacterium]|nr:DUF4185 domain-containing protein [Micrococcales bacterium]
EDIILRSADAPTGPWSDPQVVVSSADYPQEYDGYIHPWSADGTIYFTETQWNPYNVYLMKVQIDKDAQIIDPNLISDPSFERSATPSGGWTCAGTCGIDTTGLSPDYYQGVNEAYVRNTSGWNDIHQTVSVTPHTDYQLTVWVRPDASAAAIAAKVDNAIGIRDTTGTIVKQTDFSPTSTTDSWQRETLDFNSGPLSSVEVYGGLTAQNIDSGTPLWLDDFSLTATSVSANSASAGHNVWLPVGVVAVVVVLAAAGTVFVVVHRRRANRAPVSEP